MAAELSRSLSLIFLRDAEGKRPVYGGVAMFDQDPDLRDTSSSTSTSMETTAAVFAQFIRPDGPRSSRSCCNRPAKTRCETRTS